MYDTGCVTSCTGICSGAPLSDTGLANITVRGKLRLKFLSPEIWFSILVRRLLKRASFVSVQDLHDHVSSFIEYCNITLAKPFKWTHKGRPLSAEPMKDFCQAALKASPDPEVAGERAFSHFLTILTLLFRIYRVLKEFRGCGEELPVRRYKGETIAFHGLGRRYL